MLRLDLQNQLRYFKSTFKIYKKKQSFIQKELQTSYHDISLMSYSESGLPDFSNVKFHPERKNFQIKTKSILFGYFLAGI